MQDWDQIRNRYWTVRFQAYTDFCENHGLSIAPSLDTVALFTADLCKDRTFSCVRDCLCAVTHRLEPAFPGTRNICRIGETIARRILVHPIIPPTVVKKVTKEKLLEICAKFLDTASHDDKLFRIVMLISFYGMVRLTRLTCDNDSPPSIGSAEVALRNSVSSGLGLCSFLLPPSSRAEDLEDKTIFLARTRAADDPLQAFKNYITSRDILFPLDVELWLCENGTIPTVQWFMDRLQTFFSVHVRPTTNALRAGGGATHIEEAGANVEAVKNVWQASVSGSPCRVHIGIDRA
ncbi:hypothetical protein LshimejAT787_1801850 [Lyophyllum shimeji]|uniref:Uncharacterized protein n=1 Tax=Lyophyllum shimeji TaxID=47721 RepID=A0A9P3PZH1_LYOSH|nr:hypothetical protein LshimejAT787_1801850 [Lyophyllum shimeji]